AGVKDMVRMSDARMSGTAFGTIVLHITPEAAEGGPFAAVRNGDMINLDVDARTLTLEISDAEMASRLAAWTPPPMLANMPSHGYRKLYQTSVTQADIGCDFDFMLPEMTRSAPLLLGTTRRA
ncbi:MAG: dihydroxy-acid dehydratase, partial [Usitatibacteraceae bacterium]